MLFLAENKILLRAFSIHSIFSDNRELSLILSALYKVFFILEIVRIGLSMLLNFMSFFVPFKVRYCIPVLLLLWYNQEGIFVFYPSFNMILFKYRGVQIIIKLQYVGLLLILTKFI